MKKKIAIIGAGIAGLTLANLLKTNSNFEFVIYEKEEIFNLEEGFGVQLSVNGISILNKIGFNQQDKNEKYHPSQLDFYSINCNKICDLDLNKFNSENAKYTTLKRSILVESLKADLFLNNIKFGKEVKKVSKVKDKLLINFRDNTNDLVNHIIISDGVFSNTKSVVENKNIQPVYNGSIAIRTLIKNTQDFAFDKKNISLIMLKNAHIVIYPVNKKDELNLVCIVRQKFFNNINLKELIKKEILSQNKNLENLFKDKLKYWPIYISKKPSQSIYENLFYLGDAFYAFNPALAQGASQSIEAAFELFSLLSQDKKEAHSLYFQKRLEKTKLINNRSIINYYSFHLSNPILVKARNAILKKITKSKKFMNSYLGNIYQQI